MQEHTKRVFKEILFRNILIVLSVITILALLSIFCHIIYLSIKSLIEYFLTEHHLSIISYELLANGILGSFVLVLVSIAIAFPLSLGIALYQYEHRTASRLNNILSKCLDSLQGAPYIVIGLFCFLIFKESIFDYPSIAGGLAFSIIMIPLLANLLLDALNQIPEKLKEAAYALGSPAYVTVFKVIIPAAGRGIISSVLLSIARILGLAAPLLFTYEFTKEIAATKFGIPNALPLLSYKIFHSDNQTDSAIWVVFFLLILIILIISLLTKTLNKNE